MTLRRVARALPLAFPVAYLAHEVASRDHSLGAAHAGALAWSVTGGLLLWLVTAFAGGLFRRPIATADRNRYPIAVLAATGLAVYAGIELLEGHGLSGLAFGLAAAAALPAAALVSWLAAALERGAERAGSATASAIAIRARITTLLSFVRPRPRVRAGSQRRIVRAPGRAPPLFA